MLWKRIIFTLKICPSIESNLAEKFLTNSNPSSQKSFQNANIVEMQAVSIRNLFNSEELGAQMGLSDCLVGYRCFGLNPLTSCGSLSLNNFVALCSTNVGKSSVLQTGNTVSLLSVANFNRFFDGSVTVNSEWLTLPDFWSGELSCKLEDEE